MLLAWIRQNLARLGIRYVTLNGNVSLAVVSDGAFKAMEFEGLAVRGCLLLLVYGDRELPHQRAWQWVFLDWYSKEHNHVVRSTFAAELHALIDAVGQGTLLDFVLTELLSKPRTARDLAKMQDSGDLLLEMDAFVDAKAVYDSL
eukprot:12421634-Karenia_brevis.AAC.1